MQIAPFYTNVTQKGQVTIPVNFRDKVNITDKSRVSVSIEDESIVIRPVKDIAEFYGKVNPAKLLPEGLNIDRVRDYMQENYLD